MTAIDNGVNLNTFKLNMVKEGKVLVEVDGKRKWLTPGRRTFNRLKRLHNLSEDVDHIFRPLVGAKLESERTISMPEYGSATLSEKMQEVIKRAEVTDEIEKEMLAKGMSAGEAHVEAIKSAAKMPTSLRKKNVSELMQQAVTDAAKNTPVDNTPNIAKQMTANLPSQEQVAVMEKMKTEREKIQQQILSRAKEAIVNQSVIEKAGDNILKKLTKKNIIPRGVLDNIKPKLNVLLDSSMSKLERNFANGLASMTDMFPENVEPSEVTAAYEKLSKVIGKLPLTSSQQSVKNAVTPLAQKYQLDADRVASFAQGRIDEQRAEMEVIGSMLDMAASKKVDPARIAKEVQKALAPEFDRVVDANLEMKVASIDLDIQDNQVEQAQLQDDMQAEMKAAKDGRGMHKKEEKFQRQMEERDSNIDYLERKKRAYIDTLSRIRGPT